MSQISPEARTDTEKANRIILSSMEGLKRRQARNGMVVAATVASSPTLVRAYKNARESGDRGLADALRFCSAGFIGSYMEGKSNLRGATILSVLLAHREKSYEGEWCQGILDAMSQVGLIGPNH